MKITCITLKILKQIFAKMQCKQTSNNENIYKTEKKSSTFKSEKNKESVKKVECSTFLCYNSIDKISMLLTIRATYPLMYKQPMKLQVSIAIFFQAFITGTCKFHP